MPQMALPPGATLVDSGEMKLPPGAKLVTPAPADTWSNAIAEYGSKLDGAVRGLTAPVLHPIDTWHAITDAVQHPENSANGQLAQKAIDAYKKGDYTGAAAHALNWLVNGTGLGSGMDEAGEKFADGRVKEGMADTAAVGTQLVVGAKGPQIVRGTGAVADAVGEAAPKVLPAVKAGVKAAAPDVAMGTAETAGSLAVAEMLPGSDVAKYLIGAPTAADGMIRIRRGVVKGVKAGREAWKASTPVTAAPPAADPAPAPPAAPATDPILNDLAVSQTGKPFAKLTPEQQETVRNLAQRVANSQSAPSAAAAPAAPVVSDAEALRQKSAAAFEAAKGQPAAAPPVAAAAPVEAPAVPPATMADAIAADAEKEYISTAPDGKTFVLRGSKEPAQNRHVFVTQDPKTAASHGSVRAYQVKPGARIYADPEIEGEQGQRLNGHQSLSGGSAIVHTDDLIPFDNPSLAEKSPAVSPAEELRQRSEAAFNAEREARQAATNGSGANGADGFKDAARKLRMQNALKMGRWLQENELGTSEAMEAMKDAHWQEVAKRSGVTLPKDSAKTIQAVKDLINMAKQ